MANNVSFTISAVDNATATINRINNQVSKMTRPFDNLKRSVQQFNKVSGFANVKRDLGAVAKHAERVAANIAKIGAPLAALIGGGTIAGLYELSTGWARLGSETGRTAQVLGVSAQALDNLRGMGSLAGISADTMTSSFKGFSDTLQDAKWGRNQAAFSMLQYLGISLKKTSTGAIDAESAMIQFADKVKKVQERDPAAARNLAASFGVESLLPILAQGSDAMRKYQSDYKRVHGEITPEMTKRAQGFAYALNLMGEAADGVKVSIGDKLIPVLRPFIEKWTEWLAINKNLIGQKIADVVARVAKAISTIDFDRVLDGIMNFVDRCIDMTKWVDKVVTSVGGWKNVLIGVATLMAGPLALSLVQTVASVASLATKLGMAATAMAGFDGAAGAAAAGGVAALGVGLGVAAASIGVVVGGVYLLRKRKEDRKREGKTYDGLDETDDERVTEFGQQKEALDLQYSVRNPANMDLVNAAAKKYNFSGYESAYKLPAGILSAIALQESGGNILATSSTGAKGLFQFMPDTATEYGIDPLNPQQETGAAAKKLAGLLKHYNGDEQKALAAYNFGEGNLDKNGLGRIPQETANYVPLVMASQGLFAKGQAESSAQTGSNPVAANQPVNVSVVNQVDMGTGRVKTIVTTPNGVRIGQTSPVMMRP